jgi:hypothetical protein
MGTHTPGPWDDQGLDICDASDRVIARMVWDQAGVGTGAHEIAPNARLIAAAPELLEACRLALTQMEALAPTLSTASYLRAAIRKATGEDR